MTSGLTAMARAIQLLLPPEPCAGLVQAILCFVPEAGSREATLNNFVKFFRGRGKPVDTRAVGDVIVDGFWEGVRLLKNHANECPQLNNVYGFSIDILTVQRNFAEDPTAVDDIVHAVHTAQESHFRILTDQCDVTIRLPMSRSTPNNACLSP